MTESAYGTGKMLNIVLSIIDKACPLSFETELEIAKAISSIPLKREKTTDSSYAGAMRNAMLASLDHRMVKCAMMAYDKIAQRCHSISNGEISREKAILKAQEELPIDPYCRAISLQLWIMLPAREYRVFFHKFLMARPRQVVAATVGCEDPAFREGREEAAKIFLHCMGEKIEAKNNLLSVFDMTEAEAADLASRIRPASGRR
jgi:hypothetical protein